MNFIPAQDETRLRAAASGVLPNGKPVAVNADGTVSVVGGTAQSLGSKVVFDTANINQYMAATFDSNSNKVVIVYADGDNSNRGTAIVGTVSGSSISFGTAVAYNTSSSIYPDVTFDTNSNKVVIAYRDAGNSSYGTAIVGTVSGTGISFGSAVVFDSRTTNFLSAAFDSNSNKVVIAYKYSEGHGIVGTVSGTNISFGSVASFGNVGAFFTNSAFDSTNNKVVIVYKNNVDNSGSYAVVATVSGTNVSFGTPVRFTTADTTQFHSVTFDSNAGKVVIAFKGASTYGTAIVGTVSGTGISFGTAVVFQASAITQVSATFDSNLNKVVIAFNPTSTTKATFISGTVSGTSISFGASIDVDSTSGVVIPNPSLVFDSNSNKVVLPFENDADSDKGTAVVYTTGNLNLTAENYVGMSGGPVKITGSAGGTGSETVFEQATTRYGASAYDTNTNRVVIAYADVGNSSYGTAIVGTVSGTSISFGTAVVFETAEVQDVAITFDSNSNKIVIAYADEGNSSHGTAIVGTVSGTAISFGTAVVFEAANTDSISATFDSNSNKVVIAYKDLGNSNYGTVVVGTVSSTSISFGTAVVFESADSRNIKNVFDPNSNKVVISYRDVGNSSYGTAIIGTVSGTGISFGTAVVFNSNSTGGMNKPVIDSTNNKVIISYTNGGNSNRGEAKVGTVSGTGISFGTAVVFSSGTAAFYTGGAYHAGIQKVVLAYRDNTSSTLTGKYNVGTVSGTDISFSGEVIFNAGRSDNISLVYDPDSTNLVNSFEDNANSSYGTSIVFTPSTLVTNRGQVASGSSASVDIIGTVSTNQDGLTPGQSYFVQTDGTLGLTAGSPSVFAGTAISATKLLVKT
mgnify:FL=1